MLTSAVREGDLLSTPRGVIDPDAKTEISRRSLVLWLRDLGTYDELADELDGSTSKQPANQPLAAMDDDKDQWKLQAREIAKEYVRQQRVRDLYPSQTDIADKVAADLRSAGVVGSSGKPLHGSYIKRHALKGISSAKGKQLSTSKHQGK